MLFVLAFTCLLNAVVGRTYLTRFDNVTWDDRNWRLTTTYADQGHYQARASLGNGYIGINVAALGPFFEADVPVNGDNINGWPLFNRRQTFATVAGFYNQQKDTNGTNFPWLLQYGGESVVSGIPHWGGLLPQCNDSILSASTDRAEISGFVSTWDFRNGVLHWRYTWTPEECPAFDIEYSMFAHKANVHQAVVQLRISASEGANITVHDVLEGECATRSDFVDSNQNNALQWTAVSPVGLPDVKAYIYSTTKSSGRTSWSRSTAAFGEERNASSIAQSSRVVLTAGETTILTKYVGIASSDAISNPKKVARNAARSAAQAGYAQLLRTHSAEWRTVMAPDLVDDWRFENGSLPNDPDIIEQQLLSVIRPYVILQHTVSENAFRNAGSNAKLRENSIPVGGWGSDSYAGMIFWDVETWMQPGLLPSFPLSVIQAAEYRISRLPQAKRNAQDAFKSSQIGREFSENAANYPWTSARSGNCTGTGPCFDYEYHINGDIVVSFENYLGATGDIDTFREQMFPVYEAVAELYSNLLELDNATNTYTLNNATDPDEFANNVNNPAFTMILMQTVLNRANAYRRRFLMSENRLWRRQARQIQIPVDDDAGIHLEYTGMNGTIEVKQADVVLIYDILDYTSKYRLSDIDYYAGKQSLDGPGMTYGVFSIVEANEAPVGCSAYTYDLWSSQPYARAPWFQYSEQLLDNYEINGGFHPAYPFLTGMGGANRVPIYGYLGLQLTNSTHLVINPVLPPQIPRLKHRTFFWQGHGVSAVSNTTHTTIVRKELKLATANTEFTNAIPLAVLDRVYNLTYTPLVIKNRTPHLSQRITNNIAQCQRVTSPDAFRPGQFPLSAVDGAVSTKWQPERALQNSSITVDLGDGGATWIKGFAFDWAQAPPRSFWVYFSNSSDASRRLAASNRNITISNPYDSERAADVVPYASNTTNVTLSAPVYGGRYATLIIRGSQADSQQSAGATVAEWSIIAADGAVSDEL